jgi:2-desacetyl-2-hydroxyethyl bacteriochlorophyllide A dehydrogenase
MRAALITGINEPLAIRDVEVPEPGPGQVRIRIHASGICGTDIHVWHGQFPVELPIVPGHEPVGTIDACGPGVTAFSKGDRCGVSWLQRGCGTCPTCQRQKPKYCETGVTWANLGGGHQEFMLAEETGLTLIPEGVDWEVAAPLFCAGYTVVSGYRNARPQPGDRVAVIGIGGLGHLALQVAKAYGHEVIAVTSSENKQAEALELGADEVLVVKEHAGEELFAMGGVDVVISTSNGMKANSQILAGLRPEGRMVTMAVGTEAIEVDPVLALTRQISLIGSMQNDRSDMVEALDLAAAGKLKPALEVYPLDQVNEAMVRLAEGKVRYRAVLTLNS